MKKSYILILLLNVCVLQAQNPKKPNSNCSMEKTADVQKLEGSGAKNNPYIIHHHSSANCAGQRYRYHGENVEKYFKVTGLQKGKRYIFKIERISKKGVMQFRPKQSLPGIISNNILMRMSGNFKTNFVSNKKGGFEFSLLVDKKAIYDFSIATSKNTTSTIRGSNQEDLSKRIQKMRERMRKRLRENWKKLRKKGNQAPKQQPFENRKWGEVDEV